MLVDWRLIGSWVLGTCRLIGGADWVPAVRLVAVGNAIATSRVQAACQSKSSRGYDSGCDQASEADRGGNHVGERGGEPATRSWIN